jgi:hypothetical protein
MPRQNQNISSALNGGFPPIKYCLKSNDSPKDKTTKTKERFFSNAPKQNINIRQLLSNTIKKPIIITDTLQNDNLEIIDSI